jgi:hypothetical protein
LWEVWQHTDTEDTNDFDRINGPHHFRVNNPYWQRDEHQVKGNTKTLTQLENKIVWRMPETHAAFEYMMSASTFGE